jgi:hypothetical protein
MAIIGTVCVVLSCLLSLQVCASTLIRVYGCLTPAPPAPPVAPPQHRVYRANQHLQVNQLHSLQSPCHPTYYFNDKAPLPRLPPPLSPSRRILLMVPIYSIDSAISMWNAEHEWTVCVRLLLIPPSPHGHLRSAAAPVATIRTAPLIQPPPLPPQPQLHHRPP